MFNYSQAFELLTRGLTFTIKLKMPMPTPSPATATAPTACEMYQEHCSSCGGVRTYAIIMGWLQLVANIILTYVTAVVIWFSSEKLQHADVLLVLLALNGLMLTTGIYFGVVFIQGAHCGDMNDLKSYRKFAIFSIVFHLIALLAFAVLEVWIFVGLSVIPVTMCSAGLRFVAAVNKKIKMIENILFMFQVCVRTLQQLQLLPGPLPPYSYSSYFVQQP